MVTTGAATPQGDGPVVEWPIRVYFEDTDAGGIVFYANYLKFFERARTEWLRAAGVSQQEALGRFGIVFVVRSTAVDYHAPARLDDAIVIRSRVERLGRVAVHFHQEAWRAGELLASGRIKVGCVDRESLRPTAIPAPIHAAFQPKNR